MTYRMRAELREVGSRLASGWPLKTPHTAICSQVIQIKYICWLFYVSTHLDKHIGLCDQHLLCKGPAEERGDDRNGFNST